MFYAPSLNYIHWLLDLWLGLIRPKGYFPIISSIDRLMGGQKLAKGYFSSNLSHSLGDGWWGAAHRPSVARPQAHGGTEGGGGARRTLADTALRAFKLDEV
jgi:hypothetical protein